MKSLCLLLIAAVVSAQFANAGDKSMRQKIVPLAAAQFSQEQQESALKALARARKEIVTFVNAFPNTSFRIWRPNLEKGWVRGDLTARPTDEHTIMLWFRVQFDRDFTTVKDSKFEKLLVYLRSEFKDLKPGEVKAPIFLELKELDALCADTEAFLSSRKREGEKG